MALTTGSMNQKPTPKKEDPTGEMRYDKDGRGYWYNYPVEEKKQTKDRKKK